MEQLELIPSYISVTTVADRLGVSRTTVTKDAQSLGLQLEYIKDEGSGKVRSYLRLEDADKVEALRKAPKKAPERECVVSALIHISRHYGLSLDQLSGMICDLAAFLEEARA